MTEQQINSALGAITEEYPLWKAICALMDEAVDANIAEVAARTQMPEILQHNAGRLSQSLEFRDSVRGRMAEIQARKLGREPEPVPRATQE